MVRQRRRGVYARIKDGRRYWEFKAKDPYTGEWFTQSVSRRLLEQFGVQPSGKNGKILEKDAQTVRVLFHEAAKKLPAVDDEVRSASIPARELFDRYLEARCTRNGAAVLERKRTIFDDFVRCYGNLPAQQITEQHAAGFLKRLMKSGTRKGKKALAPSTARDYFSYLKAAFEFGRHVGILRANPAAYVELPEKQEPQTQVWTADEIRKKLATQFSSERWEYFRWIVTGVFVTGLSPMEWQNADWANFDPERRSLWVQDVKKKSSVIRRTEVPIPEFFLGAFVERRREAGPIWPMSGGTVFTKEGGNSLRGRARDKWPGFNFLSLRTSYSVHLQDQGVYDMQLARLLRHSDGVERGYRVASKHYSRRKDFEAVRQVADQAFSGLHELFSLVSFGAPGTPELRLAHPA